MIEFIDNHSGLFSILAIIFTIVMSLIGVSADIDEANRKAQEKGTREMNIIMDTQEPIWTTFQDRSKEFRWLEKDGKLTLQIACPFQNATGGGFEWRDIPIVKAQEK